jgi:hypothetical protein
MCITSSVLAEWPYMSRHAVLLISSPRGAVAAMHLGADAHGRLALAPSGDRPIITPQMVCTENQVSASTTTSCRRAACSEISADGAGSHRGLHIIWRSAIQVSAHDDSARNTKTKFACAYECEQLCVRAIVRARARVRVCVSCVARCSSPCRKRWPKLLEQRLLLRRDDSQLKPQQPRQHQHQQPCQELRQMMCSVSPRPTRKHKSQTVMGRGRP